MGFRESLTSGEGWLPPSARLVRDSGEVLFIDPARFRTTAEVKAYSEGWFARAFAPAQWALRLGRRDELDVDIDADLIDELNARPEGTWIAYGVAYRYLPGS
ncbi:hypothetical protein [Actinomadura alba]|uniref:Uncharacterized protein n=1 Tax=Actinomadura alba TaxID=406431 RepID=A0ABR7LQK6_9ACTN|nr:hypothetical protein [Actinomadura alba]MBC6466782.1 hypothetical protein [Actinomadura alba]